MTIGKAAEISISHQLSVIETGEFRKSRSAHSEYFRAKLPNIAEDPYEFNATYVASADKRRESFCKVSAYKRCFRSPNENVTYAFPTRCVTVYRSELDFQRNLTDESSDQFEELNNKGI